MGIRRAVGNFSKSKLERLVEFSTEAALRLAIIQKRRLQRAKSRPLNDRVIRQWSRGPMRKELVAIIVKALRCTDHFRDDPERHAQLAGAEIVQWLHRELSARVGRPTIGAGIINSARILPQKNGLDRIGGRPPFMSLEDEKRWHSRVCGVAIKLWARQQGMGSLPFSRVVESLQRDQTEIANLTRFFSSALKSQTMLGFNPPAKSHKALLKRARLAHKTYELPQQLRKSGGDLR
jgi:hypothetical protein